MKAGGKPGRVTVVIPTRDRGDSVVRALRSILAAAGDLAGVRIIDQSSDERTRVALAPFLTDAGVEHVASETRGLTQALNQGIAAVDSELVAITGDDCEADPGWLSAMIAAFDAEPRAAVVFGGVLVGGHDPAEGFVQGYPLPKRTRATRPHEMWRVGGTSACMGLRREAWSRIHGFDAQLGVGAPLRAAEELDFALRALGAGYVVCEEPASAVTHLGFLPWSALPALIERNWFGTGAAVAKLVRIDPRGGLRLLMGMGVGWTRGGGVSASFGRIARMPRLVAFSRGFRTGLRYPLDSATGHFRRASE